MYIVVWVELLLTTKIKHKQSRVQYKADVSIHIVCVNEI